MQINVDQPLQQTALFTAFLLTVLFLTAKKDSSPRGLNHSDTNELKGLAILMVIFSHIGYFLDSNDRFLYPLSVAGGVGVNLFLFLSGFGLTSSLLNSKKSIVGFYKKRFKRIYFPLWIVLSIILVIDYAFLGLNYSLIEIIKSFFGWFPNADIYTSINSPLWYFTFILFYYLVFPWLFFPDKPLLSVTLILLLSILIVDLNLPVNVDVLKLYKLHYLAFPLGMSFAVLFHKQIEIVSLKSKLLVFTSLERFIPIMEYFLVALLAFFVGYTAINSRVGEGINIEQLSSLATMSFLVLIFLLKKVKFPLLILLGTYSYEIYLIQWPLLYRYDFFYKFLPAYLATIAYLGLFILLGIALNKLAKIKLTNQ